MKLPLLVAAAVVPATSLSWSSRPLQMGKVGAGTGGGTAATSPGSALPRLGNHALPQNHHLPPHQQHGAPPSTTALHMALGGNYLDNIDGDKDEDTANFREGNGRWGIFGGRSNNNNAGRARGNNGGRNTGRGGAGTAVRPSSPTAPNGGTNNYGPGNNNRREPRGLPRVFSIRQPQDLLDFVIQDERLSVVKVYASWCKTCAVFDVRYRKLASQLGDTYQGDQRVSEGNVRFAEMKFDDPNNEEMCRLLNATKLPYILMYKGSQGKVADFQCGPAKFQMLVDAVNDHADPEGAAVPPGRALPNLGGEQEWRVVQEQQAKRNQVRRNEQRAVQYGSAGSIVNYPSASDNDKLQRKEEEISRLYAELNELRSDFDKRIVRLKEEHKKETDLLHNKLQSQTKEYEAQRRALSSQIEGLSRELAAWESKAKSRRDGEEAENQRLQGEMREKEEEYKKTLTGLNLRITELEEDLFKSRNELQYNSNASGSDLQRLTDHIAALEGEMADLTSRNSRLEKELIEEKRVVVASTEEASRVLKQLEKIKNSEDAERRQLTLRIAELEAEIAEREKQLINSTGEVSRDIQRELDRLKREHAREKASMADRIVELEEELTSRLSSSSVESEEVSRRQRRLREESERLASKIAELEDEIDERDRLLRTSNKAADRLLDNMESQKREYEDELERANSLVSELEEAISSREDEMEVLTERFESLERMATELKQREEAREEEAAAANGAAQTFQFADAMRMSEQADGGMGVGSFNEGGDQGNDSRWRMERQARRAAEEEVGRLMGALQNREEELARMQQQGSGIESAQQPPQTPFNFGALFGGGGGGGNAENFESSSWEALKDVLMPDEVSPTMQSRSGAGRSDNIREGAGLSSLMSSSGAGRSDNIWDGAGGGPAANTPSPAAAAPPAGLPTPAMAFERRLAENPIVPAGAFGGSKPTASFFSPSGQSSGGAAPTDTPEYYQNAMNNFNNRGNNEIQEPAMPPVASFELRPTAPSPRAQATYGMTENIYAGAGSASSSDNIYAGAGSASASGGSYPTPSAVPREEPAAPLPTPAAAFERRLADNPIVPAGAFGGSQPTAHFFSAPKPAPPEGPSDASSQQYPAAEDDPQSKWQRLDEYEKKRVAEEAYKAFEKSLKDGRLGDTRSQPNKGRETAGRGTGLGGVAKRSTAPVTKAKSSQSSQVEMERKKHQDMVRAASTAAGKEQQSKVSPMSKSSLPKTSISQPTQKQQQPMQKKQQPQQSAQQIQNSAAQASAKRMSLAERAAKAELERKEKERRVKAEARKAQEARQNEERQRAAEAKRREEARQNEARQRAAEAKRAEEVRQEEARQRAAEVKKAEEARQEEARQRALEAKRAEEAKQNEARQRAVEAKRAEEARENEVRQRAAQLEAKRNEEIRRAEELKRKADADLAAAKQSMELEQKLAEQKMAAEQSKREASVGKGSVESKERIEAALLGAEDEIEDDSNGGPTTPSDPKRVKRKGFAVSKYDVVVLKDPGDVDMPQLLEGSLKDLLKDDPRKRRRSSMGDLNY